MSLHRRAAKRDAVEPAIIATLRAHGAIVWQISGTGITDTIVFHRAKKQPVHGSRHRVFVAECKGEKGKPTPAQIQRWTELTSLGFSVFILRAPEDAVAMLNNALQPWEPTEKQWGRQKSRTGDNSYRLDPPPTTSIGASIRNAVRAGYTPPRSMPVDAAKEAEVFAPPACP